MADVWEEIKEKVKGIAGSWASYVALGSFALYVLGYLSIRFHLTTLGIGTDLAVLDERYVFAGAKFIVYLFSSLPIIVMFVLLLALLLAVIDRAYRLLTRKRTGETPAKRLGNALKEWFSTPTSVAVLGIVISVILIQIVMRKCFLFSNLLLAESLPESGLGLEQLLLDDDDGNRSLFFVGLVTGATVSGALWLYGRSLEVQTTLSKFLLTLLAFLVLVQCLFLPVNYGVFIMDKSIPRVSDLGDQVPLPQNQRAWLVWEGTQGLTYLVETSPATASESAASAQSPITATSPAASPLAVTTNSATPPTPSPNPTTTASPAGTTPATGSPTPASSTKPTPLGTSGAASETPAVMSGKPCITRKLVTLQHKDLKRTEILGYDPIIKLIFSEKDGCK